VPDTISARKGLTREDLFTVVHDTSERHLVLRRHRAARRYGARTRGLLAAYGNYYSAFRAGDREAGESLDNQEMFRRLARAMGYDEPCFSQSDEDMIRELIDPEVNALFEGVSFEQLQRDAGRAPIRILAQMGRKQRQVADPVGRIEIYSEALRDLGVDPLPAHVNETEGLSSAAAGGRYPLQVISAATHYFIGASFQHVPRCRK